jgi:hypothetical protein
MVIRHPVQKQMKRAKAPYLARELPMFLPLASDSRGLHV